MYKILILVSVFFLVACQAAIEETPTPSAIETPAETGDTTAWKLAAPEYPPYYGTALLDQGFITEIVLAALQAESIQANVEFVPWARAIQETELGNYDGLFTVWFREDRALIFEFSDPLPANEIAFLTLKENNIEYNSIEDLTELTVGTVREYTYPDAFLNAGLTTEEVTVDNENINKLLADRIDVAIIDKTQGQFLIDTEYAEHKEQFVWLEPSVELTDQFFVISKQTIDAEERINQFNRGLQQIKDNGVYAQILEKHGFTHYLEGDQESP